MGRGIVTLEQVQGFVVVWEDSSLIELALFTPIRLVSAIKPPSCPEGPVLLAFDVRPRTKRRVLLRFGHCKSFFLS